MGFQNLRCEVYRSSGVQTFEIHSYLLYYVRKKEIHIKVLILRVLFCINVGSSNSILSSDDTANS